MSRDAHEKTESKGALKRDSYCFLFLFYKKIRTIACKKQSLTVHTDAFLRKILLDIQRKFTYSVPVENY